MNASAMDLMRNAAKCAILCALATQADAKIAGAANPHVDTAALQGVMEPNSPCARAFQGLGLRLDSEKPYRQVALHREARNNAEQGRECPQQRWQIPANDLTVRLER